VSFRRAASFAGREQQRRGVCQWGGPFASGEGLGLAAGVGHTPGVRIPVLRIPISVIFLEHTYIVHFFVLSVMGDRFVAVESDPQIFVLSIFIEEVPTQPGEEGMLRA
jgi:hypothetical protein